MAKEKNKKEKEDKKNKKEKEDKKNNNENNNENKIPESSKLDTNYEWQCYKDTESC